MSNANFWKKVFLGATLLLFCSGTILAVDKGHATVNVVDGTQQGRTVTVVVSDAMGPIIGANVMVKGTTIGNITDMDGRAVIEGVPANATLVVSYIGYVAREVAAGNQSNINVTLSEDTQALDEVVVVGYGTQAKKDITGSVAVVNTEDLQEIPVATVAEALQGRASGVYIQTSGAPGASTSIRIRGVGSVNDAAPLVVVDGVSGAPMESVNPNDIESLQILKDASATAIYGAKGANGVIIITTKQGDKGGRVRVSYDGYVGTSKMANSGYDVLNGWEAMEFEALGMVNLRDVRGKTPAAHAQFGALNDQDQLTMPYAIKPAGYSKDQIISQYGSVDAWVAGYKPNGGSSFARSAYYQMLEDGYSEADARKGTDWYDLVTQSGFIQDHQLSVLGGHDKGSYSMSVGYSSREGTLKSSFFDRYSLRANSTFSPNKYITIGQNTNLSVMEMGGDRGNGGEGSVYAKTYTMQSWVPVYNVGGDLAGSQATNGGRDVSSVYIASEQAGSFNRNFRGQSSVFAEVKPIDGLTVKTQFAATLRGENYGNFYPVTIMHNKEGRGTNEYTERMRWWFGYQWTNTIAYTKKINEDQTISVVAGTEALKENLGRWIEGNRKNFDFEDDPNMWILSNGGTANMSATGEMNSYTTMFGYFGRADYSYQGKYLVSASIRRDASSRFSEKNRWGTFPSVSLGWRMSDEAFMESTRSWLDDFKLRAGYGTTGNSSIGAYNYAFQYGTGNNYWYSINGSDAGVYTGYHVTNLGDVNAKWETVKTLNLGFDATALNNKLTLSLEWYNRETSDMLVDANWSALAGSPTRPRVNIGNMRNRGIDFSVGYRDKIGDLRYNINANLSTYRNKITKLGGSDLFEGTRISNISIMREGLPMAQFFGYKVVGIYKSEEDVLNYKNSKGQTILPYGASSLESLDPSQYIGRYKMADIDDDGMVGSDDRTVIGNPHPDFTGGVNISLQYKNFDLSTYLYFSVGNDLYKMFEYYTHYGALQSNYSKDRRDNSWHPVTNPNGKYPLWAGTSQEGAEAGNESHSMYIEDGSYLRMQTLSLGYTLPRSITGKLGLERLRVYGQVANVFTLTGYSGLDPEVRQNRTDDRQMGFDYGSYGMPRQFIFGVNVSF
ncbi:TonB-dependent receptor [Parabacteroides sp. PF5-9]|uniref:SusC/RagA family TonB-linked outer membrane protein n=1 Tax=Parabacteroides sp. PF5-9 TaxID=1742404 RepID=UPI002475F319|nr:TonB-dependent receptor [Parabacteroides sp. PF5-9]MDH6357099.1 TonB-linked SusC/RagA family outer membrane protein [Parabacteroides sp. PF5-9]